MQLSRPQSTDPAAAKAEFLLSFSRRAMFLLLATISFLGATIIALILWPNQPLASVPGRMPWLLPALLAFAAAMLRRGKPAPTPRDLKVVLDDEFRRANMARAQRAGLAVVLVVQVPLGLLLLHFPAPRALMAMAAATITVGMSAVVGAFLVFDRD